MFLSGTCSDGMVDDDSNSFYFPFSNLFYRHGLELLYFYFVLHKTLFYSWRQIVGAKLHVTPVRHHKRFVGDNWIIRYVSHASGEHFYIFAFF